MESIIKQTSADRILDPALIRQYSQRSEYWRCKCRLKRSRCALRAFKCPPISRMRILCRRHIEQSECELEALNFKCGYSAFQILQNWAKLTLFCSLSLAAICSQMSLIVPGGRHRSSSSRLSGLILIDRQCLLRSTWLRMCLFQIVEIQQTM